MRQSYERQLGEKNTEISLLKDKTTQLQSKIDMLNLEIIGMKDANEKNNGDKLREIEKLKQTMEELNRVIEGLKNNSSDQIKELERMIREGKEKFEKEIKEVMEEGRGKLAELERVKMKEMEEMKEGYEKMMRELKEEWERKMEKQKGEYEKKIK